MWKQLVSFVKRCIKKVVANINTRDWSYSEQSSYRRRLWWWSRGHSITKSFNFWTSITHHQHVNTKQWFRFWIWANERKCYKQFLTISGLDGGESMWHHYVNFRNHSKINQQRNNQKDWHCYLWWKSTRHLWRLGRDVDIIARRDCNIRAAKSKVGKTGAIINRPIYKLYPLECSITHDTEDNVN